MLWLVFSTNFIFRLVLFLHWLTALFNFRIVHASFYYFYTHAFSRFTFHSYHYILCFLTIIFYVHCACYLRTRYRSRAAFNQLTGETTFWRSYGRNEKKIYEKRGNKENAFDQHNGDKLMVLH